MNSFLQTTTMGYTHTPNPNPPTLIYNIITPKSCFTSSLNEQKQQLPTIKQQIPKLLYNVKLKTLGDCRLGISRYPDFDYNADGGAGVGTAAASEDGAVVSVDFDVEQLYIPPLSSVTTKLLGLPLPPFLKIDIVPELLRGKINQESGKVDLKLRAKFWFSVGSLYKAAALVVETVLTSEESKGEIRGGKGKRLDKDGSCSLVGVATVARVDDIFLNTFLALPTECLATLNAIISFSTTP